MPEFVDTHCHIQSAGREVGERGTSELWAKEPELNVDTIIGDARVAGVTKLICVGCDLEDSRLAVDFAQEHDNCWASIGIHPHEAKLYAGQDSKLKEFSELAQQSKVVAIGECGLDYYYGHSPPAAQEQVLRRQIELAQKHGLPVIFHVREAFEDFWRIFEDYQGVRGVLHSFTDSSINLQRAINKGLYIGVNGIATFAKNPSQIDMYKAVPLDRLLLETDAPFLTPTPHRGTINQPKHISLIAKFLAGLRGEEPALLAEATTANCRVLFEKMP
jgi:TatD DNase family protein